MFGQRRQGGFEVPLELERPTGDFCVGPAMSETECLDALNRGMAAVGPGLDLVAVGEMGIGNTASAAAIGAAQLGLANKIRLARAGATEGEIFTAAISVTFKNLLIREVDEGTLAAVMDDNPGEFAHPINGTYPDGKPFATMPVNILAALPQLPADLEYRFTGHHLILVDTRANVILDRMPCAIDCARR